MNTKNIEPISIWTPSGVKNATILALHDFYGYHFDNGAGKVVYKLIGMQSNGSTTLEDGTTVQSPESASEYLTDAIDIPADIIQQWGADDGIIWDYVATTLGLILV